MIGWLEGNIRDKELSGRIVLDVSGVGYDVELSLHSLVQAEQRAMQGHKVALWIHTVVREDAFALYGFFEKAERSLFRELIRVNGVGPKSAIGILSSSNPEEFVSIIEQEDLARLTKIPGIGKKTAERLLVEMRDSLKRLQQSAVLLGNPTPGSEHARNFGRAALLEASQALESLGYRPQESSKVLKKIDDGQMSAEELVRQSLRQFAVV